MVLSFTHTRSRLRTALVALVAAVSLATIPAAVDPAQAAAAQAASCTYKGEETSDGGVIKQDDGNLYKCINGKWVYQGKAPAGDVAFESGDW